ncbi:MAG: pyridoxamine 5'-phosphate oxidase family protein [Methanobacterium sp.]|nr:pyridoxamine 5'-phosphate oxidase family protein [Methanobacterium sp.]
MRRSDKEINSQRLILKILEEAEVCRIALCEHGKPYIVPMNFGFVDKTLYLHSATSGRKIEIIAKNNNVCFQMDIKTQLVTAENPCNWGMRYLSVIGSGQAQLINDQQDKMEALDIIMSKYSEKSFEYSPEALDSIMVIKVEIEEITGKKSGY